MSFRVFPWFVVAAAASAAAQRLPAGVMPNQYEVTVAPDLKTSFTGEEDD